MASHQGVQLARHLILVAVVVQSTLFLSLIIVHPLDRCASGLAWSRVRLCVGSVVSERFIDRFKEKTA